jgi:lipopolysaccharide export LptBFGC system permease protein LptF
MNKLYYLACLFSLSYASVSAQELEKIQKSEKPEQQKPKVSYVAVKGGSPIIYYIDGVRTESALDYFNLKAEDVYSMEIVNDAAEIAKKYARKGEKFQSVIVIETKKYIKSTSRTLTGTRH